MWPGGTVAFSASMIFTQHNSPMPIARRRTACYCSQGLKVDLHGHILSLTDSKKGTGPLALHVKGSCFRLRSLDSRGKSCTGRFHRTRARAKTTPAMTNDDDDDSVIGGMHGAGGPRCRHAEHRAHVVGTTSCRRCMRREIKQARPRPIRSVRDSRSFITVYYPARPLLS